MRLENPLAPTADRLRSTLLGNMLAAIAANVRTVERVALFEIGKVFWPLPGELLPAEPEHIAIGLAGARDAGAWLNRVPEPMDFLDLKGVVETLLDHLGLLAVARFEPVAASAVRTTRGAAADQRQGRGHSGRGPSRRAAGL